jgi:hemerythrin-like domain-containing protein
MQVRGPLMVEHRLIEQVIEAMNDQLARIETTGQLDTRFIETCVDFLRTYVDRTHHGKEEDILFRELSKRSLAATDEQLMDELIAEHTIGRETTKALAEANRLHRNRDASTRRAVREGLRTLTELYPRHIAREDQVFFPAARAYFTDSEEQAMLGQFWEFDRRMIHEKYRSVARGLAGG